MATATIKALVLDRRKVEFTSKTTGEVIMYYEARLYGVNDRCLYVFRSQQAEAFEDFEAGATIEVDCEVDKTTNVQATVLRPVRDDGGVEGGFF